MTFLSSRHHSTPTRQKGPKTPFFSKTNVQSIQAKEEHPFFQPKLTINQPGDKYEQEADAMAEQVVQAESIQRQTNPEEEEMMQAKPLSEAAIQRQCAECEEAGQLQRQAAPEEEEMLQSKPLMRVAENGAATATPQLASQLNSSKGSGQPLPKGTLSSMNDVFGADFSGVRVHVGSRAEEMSQGIQAKAFTHGSDIYFNRGQYNPGSTEGKRLLGHELTHVVQQGGRKEQKIRADRSDTSQVHLLQAQKASQPFFSEGAGRKDGEDSFFSKAPRADYVSNESDGNIIQRDDEASTTMGAPAPVVTNADRAQHIATALRQTSPAFTNEPGTTLPNGGAFHILRLLNSNDLIETISYISVPNRQLIFDNLNLETDFYQKTRFKTVLKSVSWGQLAEGVERLNLLQSLYLAGLRKIIEFFNSFFGGNLSGISDGILTGVFTNMQGMTKEEIITLMQTLDETFVQYLHSKLHLALAGDRNRISNLMNDFLGATRMESDDYIDVTNLTGLARRMAMIYNTKGQYIASQARTFGVDSGVLAGFITIESGARAFDGGTDRPLIRFENHVFWRRWGRYNRVQFNQHFRYNTTGDAWTGHLYRVNNTSPWQTFHGNQTREWEAVNIATGLSDQETAYLCMSMGMGQIMGFNFANAGFANAVEMFDAFNQNESSQIDGMLSFINNNANLLTAVRNRDFANIARYYNGSGQMGVYGPRIQRATQVYDNVTAGKLHIVP